LREQPVPGAHVIPVALHVDYFDRDGWRDAFSSPLFSGRQNDYARRLGSEIYTPQVVVNGRTAVVGTRDDEVDRAIAAAAARTPVDIDVSARMAGGQLEVQIGVPAAPQDSEPLEVMAAITQGGLTTDVTRGENRGRQLHHVAVARTLTRVGALERVARTIAHRVRLRQEWGGQGLSAVVWLQGRRSGQVYGARAVPVSP
jgi:hypothetical protein